MSFICSVIKHVPDRTRVWDDGQDFRAPCRRCGVPMIKDLYAGWRTFDSDRDYAGGGSQRGSRPEHR